MYGMDIQTTVKTLLSKGASRRKIAEQLGIPPGQVFPKYCNLPSPPHLCSFDLRHVGG